MVYFHGESGLLRFSSALTCAVLEWFLILLLFTDAWFSSLVTKFSRRYKLRAPCFLCSRLDHILGNENPDLYKHLICDYHVSEISSWGYYCNVREKLRNVRKVCQGCLLSASSENLNSKSPIRYDCECLHSEVCGECTLKIPLLRENNESVIQMLPAEWTKNKSLGAKVAEIDILDSSLLQSDDCGLDRLSHIFYSELKFTSDTESEVLFPEDVEKSNFVCNKEPKDTGPHSDEFKITSGTKLEILFPEDGEKGHFVHDDQQKEDMAPHFQPETPVLIETSVVIPEEPHEMNGSLEFLSFEILNPTVHDQEQLNSSRIKVENNILTSLETASHIGRENVSDAKLAFASAEPSLDAHEIINVSGSSHNISMDLKDAYELAIGNKTNSFPSSSASEIITSKDFSRVPADLKLLLSQLSGGLEFSLNNIALSPRAHGLDFLDASSSIILQNISKTISIERNLSGVESLDGSLVSEIEGESPLDRLNRQIELDRKSIRLLYKELEEERGSSATAANQAMAMITRLQEEKAAIEMEALQYQRMMEEQAEYDQEAIQNLNFLLAQKEKEIQDLEAEFESFKNQVHCEIPDYTLKEPSFAFENEKVSISENLKKLEKKLIFFSSNGLSIDPQCSHKFEYVKFEPGSHFLEGHGDFADIRDEISMMSARLSALEADQNFLKHAINSLRHENDGFKFIEEIVRHMRELRRTVVD